MNTRNKNILLGVLIVGVLSMTVAFAALSTRLNIGGTTQVASTTWNIHFDNWDDDTESTVQNEFGTQQNTAVYPSAADLTKSLAPNITKVEGINVTLKQPNDYVRYTFEIVNDGTIDATLQNFTHSMDCQSGKNCDFMEYEVKCYESSSLTGNEVVNTSVLAAGRRAYCYLQVKYKDQTNNTAKANTNNVSASVNGAVYTQEAVTASLSANWSWVQRQNTQTGGQGGSETPSNSYATTFTGTYGYDFPGAATLGNGGESEWVSELDPEVTAYLRHSSSAIQTCGVFGSGQSGTVCLDASSSGYSSDFEDVTSGDSGITTSSGLQSTGLKGYSLAKAEEMLSRGASSCDVFFDSYYRVNCDMTSGGLCGIASDGYVYCDDGGNTWHVSSDGSTTDHSAP